MLFNEPKLLKCTARRPRHADRRGFSALQRAEIAEIRAGQDRHPIRRTVSVLFNEPKLLKSRAGGRRARGTGVVSVLFNEPKLLKWRPFSRCCGTSARFSALQRAEIAEIVVCPGKTWPACRVFQCSSTSRNC